MTRAPSHHAWNAPRLQASLAGNLVLIGGALDESAEILQRVIALAAGGREAGSERYGAPRIAILTTASEPAGSAEAAASNTEENDEADGRYYIGLFERHGAVGVPIPIGVSPEPTFAGSSYHRGSAKSEQIAELVRSCDGVFLGGGDQTHYVLALFESARPELPPFGERRDTAVMRALREVLERGGVVAGTSAGLAVQQAAPMVSGGTSRAAWEHGATPGYEDDDRLRHIEAGGLGFFGEGLLDSHFNEWGRVTRAIRLAHDTSERLAVGVDEHTALVYSRADRTGEVVGSGGVSVLDISEAKFDDGTRGKSVTGVRWSHLTAGERYDFATGETSRAAEILFDPEIGEAPKPATDIWGEDRGIELLRLAQGLLASSGRVASATTSAPDGKPSDTRQATDAPEFSISLERDSRTAWTRPGGFADLCLSITPLSLTS